MKEVKEVVHVPTRELAEEVLRVAKENGLMKILEVKDWEYYKTETYFRPDEHGGYSGLAFAKTNSDEILTAEEFLNRYKPKFRPIAMKCTQEQFDLIKGKLAGCEIVYIDSFITHTYLVNNQGKSDLRVTNLRGNTKTNFNRQVFEEWNEKTFLEYCGISIGTEDSHKDLHVKGCFNTDKYELEQLRKENEELRSINDTLNKESIEHHNELTLLKEQLKAIEDQPKVGDVCLFFDRGVKEFSISIFKKYEDDSYWSINSYYDNCIKATNENIQAKINELKNK